MKFKDFWPSIITATGLLQSHDWGGLLGKYEKIGKNSRFALVNPELQESELLILRPR
jgi:hypothetical protein